MDSTALHDLFRSEVRDEATPYLWSDVEIYSYIDDAQKMFCRLQGGIADASSAVTHLNVTAGDVFVPISPLILKLREARRSADGYDLEILNFEDMQSHRPVDDYGYRSGYRIDNTVGIVKAIVVGMETNKIRLVQIPQEDQSIDLIVYRMPLVPITAAGAAAGDRRTPPPPLAALDEAPRSPEAGCGDLRSRPFRHVPGRVPRILRSGQGRT